MNVRGVDRAERGVDGALGAGEAGFVAGGEALALGVVVFVVGTLLVLSGWRLVDGKLAVETAAREAARAAVEAPLTVLDDPAATAELVGRRARDTVVAHRGEDGSDATWAFVDATVVGTVARCAPLTATVTIEVATVPLPLPSRGLGTVRLVGRHTERIEPYRGGLSVVDARC